MTTTPATTPAMTTPGPTTTARKLGLLGSLYFSQGLPFGFFTQALPILLRKNGSGLGAIGLSSLLALPWALKFLWAPAVDRHGSRKAWIVPLQALSVAALAAVAAVATLSPPSGPPMTLLMGASLALNLLAATQDIATDGMAVDLLAPSERGWANGLQVAGYRVGMIVGGGVLLVLYERWGARSPFLIMAALTAAASLPLIASRSAAAPRPRAAEGSARASVGQFLRRPGAGRVLLLITTYKAGDAFATSMLRPFLADAGLTLADVGKLLGTVGFVAGLLGALAGGALVNRLGRRRSLLAFGAAQAVTVAGYAYVAIGRPSLRALYGLCAAEHFAGGMATAALFTCMMDWCRRESSATDYTVQASAVVIATGVASAAAGFSAQALGYFGHFCLAAALALLSLAPVALGLTRDGQARAPRAADDGEVLSCG
jgi:PAT family beta-lactamase induction signal transducer AmpG